MKDIILELIKDLEYDYYHHIPAETSEEVAKIRGTDPHIGAKAIIVRSKGKYYQFVLRGTDKIDNKKIKVNTPIKKFSFISEQELNEHFNLERGAVPPFGKFIKNIEEVFFDQSLAKEEFLAFNIGTKTDSIKIKSEYILNIVKPKVIDLV